MERRLYQAAVEGDVPSLLQLLHEDKLLLDRSMVAGATTETPLHIAAMLGHLEFTDKLLQLKPQLAYELDSQKSTPLHLAAAKGYAKVAESLVMVDSETCLATDKYGRNPVQVAAVKGRVEVLQLLLKARPDAAMSVSRKGETVLHMCVKHNQLESLMVLVRFLGGEDDGFVNRRDGEGNSVLHLAAMDDQTETMEFLLNNTNIELECVNHHGMKARDLLVNTWGNTRDTEAGNRTQPDGPQLGAIGTNRRSSKGSNWKKLYKRQNHWVIRMRESLMVVAILTATMAFQAGLNPPAGVWQQNSPTDTTTAATNLSPSPSAPPETFPRPFFIFFEDQPSMTPQFIGYSVMADNSPILYDLFLGLNTTSFLASLSVILLLISGLPTRNRLFMLTLMLVMWIAITSIAFTYAVAIAVLTPQHQSGVVNRVIQFIFIAWFGVMILMLLSHTIRLVIKAIGKVFRAILRERKGFVCNSGLSTCY